MSLEYVIQKMLSEEGIFLTKEQIKNRIKNSSIMGKTTTNKTTKQTNSKVDNNINAQNQQQTRASLFQEEKNVLLQDAEEGKKQLIHELYHFVYQRKQRGWGSVNTGVITLYDGNNNPIKARAAILIEDGSQNLLVHVGVLGGDVQIVRIENFSYDEIVNLIKGILPNLDEIDEEEEDDDETDNFLESLGVDIKINGKKASTEDVLAIIAKILGGK